MAEVYERYRLDRLREGWTITLDQRRSAAINVALGLGAVAVGWLFVEGSFGYVLIGVGTLWALAARGAYRHTTTTTLGDPLRHARPQSEQTLPREALTGLLLWRTPSTKRRRKREPLSWHVDIAGEAGVFTTHRFQSEAAARAFGARLSELLGVPLTERPGIRG